MRDGGCIPRVFRGQSRGGGRPAASFGPWATVGNVSQGASQRDRSIKTGIVVLRSESNQLAFCGTITAQVRDLRYLLSRTQAPKYSKGHWAD